MPHGVISAENEVASTSREALAHMRLDPVSHDNGSPTGLAGVAYPRSGLGCLLDPAVSPGHDCRPGSEQCAHACGPHSQGRLGIGL
jgi:hypothetical protein